MTKHYHIRWRSKTGRVMDSGIVADLDGVRWMHDMMEGSFEYTKYRGSVLPPVECDDILCVASEVAQQEASYRLAGETEGMEEDASIDYIMEHIDEL